MKKTLAIVLALVVALCLAACGGLFPGLPDTPSTDPAPQETTSPEQEIPPTADIVINEELLALVGASNAEVKAINGTACEQAFLITGGTPCVSYYDLDVPYPLSFVMFEGPVEEVVSNFTGITNVNSYPDDLIVTQITGFVAPDTEKGESFTNTLDLIIQASVPLTEENLNAFFGQTPQRQPLVDNEMTDYAYDYFLLYTYNGVVFDIAFNEGSPARSLALRTEA
jgi:hypothetical protein